MKLRAIFVLIYFSLRNFSIAYGFFEDCSVVSTPSLQEALIGYYLDSPNYPNARYAAGSSCRYSVKVPFGYVIDLTCNINIDEPIKTCITDKFYISNEADQELIRTQFYCGFRKVQVTSLFNEITFGHISQTLRNSGYYSCYIKARKQSSCECGWSSQARIVNGVEASPNEFISVVGIQKLSEPASRVFAGGTIVHYRYILTAAHVVYNDYASNFQALVGYHDVASYVDTKYSRRYGIEEIVIHNYYDPNTNSYDIALLRTSTDIQFNYGVGPACLPVDTTSQQNRFRLANNYVTVAGWGSQTFGGPAATRLRKVDLLVLGERVCQNIANRNSVNLNLNPFKMCTEATPKDTCQGDSGGGLFYYLGGRQFVVGIVSYGFTCGTSPVPAVNTRIVSQITYWIIQNIKESSAICRK
jgi:V8-like Glu-specific endopeptidase